MIFVIEYDREKGELVKMLSFKDAQRDEAFRARLALEIKLLRENLQREVVLLEASDEATLRSTHGRYFSTAIELAKVGGNRVGALEMEDASKVRSRLQEMKSHGSSPEATKRKKPKS